MTAPLPDVATLAGMTPLGNEAEGLRNRSPREIAREFEAMLVAQMISAMRKTVPESGLLGSSPHRQVLDGVFDLEMARALTEDGGLGLADVLGRQLVLAEAKAGASPSSHGGAAPARTGLADAAAKAAEGAASGVAIDSPVRGRLSSGFGPRRHPITGESHFHSGIDVAAPRGSEVSSPAAGEVVEVGLGGAAGRFVRVRHGDGTTSSYAHLDTVLVRSGQTVQPGETLGTVGDSGRATGPHLHLSVQRDGTAIDPLAWLGRSEGGLA
jgi:murein DD-endopeptidase MepM/ murein hydrolase activator NlpD